MAVTKRLRFEILRRDNHACRYCGGIAPDVILTIDHVVPKALGGSDDPGNLVTACKDCNAGKSSVPAGAELVADVSQDAVRWANAMRAAFDAELARTAVRDEYLGEFLAAWNGWTYDDGGSTVDLPADWERSIEKWYALGFPFEMLKDAIRGAMTKRNLKGNEHPRFRYMAGIVWGTLTEMEDQAAAMLAAPSAPAPTPAACDDPWCVHHLPDHSCPHCEAYGRLWACGYEQGAWQGRLDTEKKNVAAIDHYEFLSMCIDSKIKEPFLVAIDAEDND